VPAKKVVGQWLAIYFAAFLLGAALGGPVFGWMGDKYGRARAMGLSILQYSIFTGAAYFVTSLEQLIVLRFIACLGVGGMWPTGVALASEAWSNGSRPLMAGLIGTAANVGFVVLAVVSYYVPIKVDDWRWVMILGATPAILGVLVLLFVPESPLWLAQRDKHLAANTKPPAPMSVVFRPPYTWVTIVGILLGTIPLLGAWGTLNWTVLWTDDVGEAIHDPKLKAITSIYRSTGASLGSLIGGYLASYFGRRSTYFVISLLSLLSSAYIFWYLTPISPEFRFAVFFAGFVGTVFFGWLPLYLPELYPTPVRATGTGVTFNFGRIASAFGVLGTGELMRAFNDDYSQVGRITCMIYLFGMLVILFAPDTSKKRLDE
jgi:SHS family sialic acid transporter-like MFS transporter